MRLAEWLKQENKTATDLAAEIPVDTSTVTRYVNGQRVPRKEHMRRIRDITNGAVTADDFMSPDAPSPTDPTPEHRRTA